MFDCFYILAQLSAVESWCICMPTYLTGGCRAWPWKLWRLNCVGPVEGTSTMIIAFHEVLLGLIKNKL